MGRGLADPDVEDPGVIPGQVRPLTKRKKKNILTIDGGGIRGLLMLDILKAIQDQLDGRELFEVFDMIIGVSAGAIISCSAGLIRPRALMEGRDDFDLAYCKAMFHDMRTFLFGCKRSLPLPSFYDRAKLENILASRDAFSGTTFADFPTTPSFNYPYVGVVAASVSHTPPIPVLFSNHSSLPGGTCTSEFVSSYPPAPGTSSTSASAQGPLPDGLVGPHPLDIGGASEDDTAHLAATASAFSPPSSGAARRTQRQAPRGESMTSRTREPNKKGGKGGSCDGCGRRSVGPPLYIRRGSSCAVPLWAAATASSCVPLAFEPIACDGMTLVDGGVVVSNPTGLAIDEAKRLWGADSIGTVVSIGSGIFATATPHVVALSHDCSQAGGGVGVPGAGSGGGIAQRARTMRDSVAAVPEYVTLMMEGVGAAAQVHAAVEQALPADVGYYRFNPRIAAVGAFETRESCLSMLQRQTADYLASPAVSAMLEEVGEALLAEL